MNEESGKYSKLSPEEQRIIDLVREMQYGEISVSVKEGRPVRVELKRSILLKENGSR